MFFTFFDKIPLLGAKLFVVCILAIIGIWIMFLPSSYLNKGLVKPKIWQNLKVWVFLLTITQIAIYLIF